MHRKAINAIVICFVLPSLAFGEFSRDGWPGEGVPAFAAKNEVIVLHSELNKESEPIELCFTKGKKITWDQSRVITKKPTIVTAKQTVTDGDCDRKPIELKPGDIVEFLQYASEGYGYIRFEEKICQVFLYGEGDFDGLENAPEIEWWVRVTDENQSPLGWLLVDEKQVSFLKREF